MSTSKDALIDNLRLQLEVLHRSKERVETELERVYEQCTKHEKRITQLREDRDYWINRAREMTDAAKGYKEQANFLQKEKLGENDRYRVCRVVKPR